MTPELQAQMASLQQQVSALQRQLGPMAQSQLSLPLDPLTIAAIKSVTGGSSNSGFVSASGAPGTPFPRGWSAARIATGFYTVTHGLGLPPDGYVVHVELANPGFTSAVYVRQAAYFTLEIDTTSPPSAANADFAFTLVAP